MRRAPVAQHLGHEDVRERAVLDAEQRVERDASRRVGRSAFMRRRRGRRRARRRATRARPSPACLGLHLVERERAVASCRRARRRAIAPGASAGESPAGSARARATPSRAGRRRRTTRPGAGCRRARPRELRVAVRARIEAELVDRRACRRTSARRLAVRASRSARAAAARRAARCRGRRAGRAARPRSRSGAIGVPRAREHRPGVEPGFDAHEAHAGLGVAREDRPLDGRRAAPAGQEREVQVHEAVRQRLEQRHGKQLPERDDDAEPRRRSRRSRRRPRAPSRACAPRARGRARPASPATGRSPRRANGAGRVG